MKFGEAIEELKQGHFIAREGWNGKNMHLIYVSGSKPGISWGDYQVKRSLWDGEILPFIAMKTAQDTLVPWLASQTDILSEDWVVVY
jgi:hypothetical protein